VACIYAELSRADSQQGRASEDLAIALLRRAVDLWRENGTGPDETELIRQDLSQGVFPDSMSKRPEFEALLTSRK